LLAWIQSEAFDRFGYRQCDVYICLTARKGWEVGDEFKL